MYLWNSERFFSKLAKIWGIFGTIVKNFQIAWAKFTKLWSYENFYRNLSWIVQKTVYWSEIYLTLSSTRYLEILNSCPSKSWQIWENLPLDSKFGGKPPQKFGLGVPAKDSKGGMQWAKGVQLTKISKCNKTGILNCRPTNKLCRVLIWWACCYGKRHIRLW